MSEQRASERAQGRGIAGGALVAIAGLLAGLALVYTNSTGVTEVADDARLLQQAESALGATTAARNAIGQALLLFGSTDDPSLVAAAVAETRSVLDAMEERVLSVAGASATPTRLEEDLAVVLFDTAAVLDLIADGDLDRAGEMAAGSAASLTRLTDGIATLRDDLGTRIASAAAQSGSVATASRFMVAFFVPSIAVVAAFVVTRRRRKRELLAVELEQERALSKSKDQLIANLSHELRTPLTGIYTSALAIEEMGFTDLEIARELTGIIVDESADLTRMVEDLLVSAQADAGRLRFDIKPTEIEVLVANLEKEFERIDAQIDFVFEPGLVLIDSGRFRQLLRNLISNAAKYGNGRVDVSGRLTGSSYVVCVSDDGPGVPAEVEERMFERFVHRGDLPLIVGSVGLGLAISKMLAEGMDGRIAYRRTENHTIFEVTLQTAERPASEPSPDWLRAGDVAADAAPDLAPGAAPDMVDVATTSAGDSNLKSDDDNESATRPGLAGIALSDGIRHALEVEGVSTIEDLLALSEQDLLAIEGIGSSSLRVIERSLAEQDSFPTEA